MTIKKADRTYYKYKEALSLALRELKKHDVAAELFIREMADPDSCRLKRSAAELTLILPAWTESLPDSALLGTLDILKIIGVKSTNYTAIGKAIDDGYLPQKYTKIKSKNFWLVGDLRKLVALRMEGCKNG